jgi:alkylated DNA repair dioxygenase AlkB
MASNMGRGRTLYNVVVREAVTADPAALGDERLFAYRGSVQLQQALFGGGEPALLPDPAFERTQLDETSWVDVARPWIRGADTLLASLTDQVDWRCGRRFMYDRYVDDPRLSRWYRAGEELPHPVLQGLGRALERRYHVPLVGPALNYYRNGRDSVAWHRDRELRHLDRTLVAILTVGARRPFLVRPVAGGPSIDLAPGSGDLLVMGGACQRDWLHTVPKTARNDPRISLSWRWSSGRGRSDRGRSWRAPRRYADAG